MKFNDKEIAIFVDCYFRAFQQGFEKARAHNSRLIMNRELIYTEMAKCIPQVVEEFSFNQKEFDAYIKANNHKLKGGD
jgi:hypothetical protein